MSNTLDKIVTKAKKKVTSPLDASPAFSSEKAPLEKAKDAPAFPSEKEPPRSACVTLGVSKEGVIVVGPDKFRKIFSTVEEARAWLKA